MTGSNNWALSRRFPFGRFAVSPLSVCSLQMTDNLRLHSRRETSRKRSKTKLRQQRSRFPVYESARLSSECAQKRWNARAQACVRASDEPSTFVMCVCAVMLAREDMYMRVRASHDPAALVRCLGASVLFRGVLEGRTSHQMPQMTGKPTNRPAEATPVAPRRRLRVDDGDDVDEAFWLMYT